MIKTPEGEVILHANGLPYDPAKAHEYYLRVRQLKGRKTGSADSSGSSGGKSRLVTATPLHVKVASINAKIDRLKTVLARLVAESKSRADKKPDAKKKTPGKDSPKHHEKQTAKEAQASKDYYEKHKDKSKTPQKKKALADQSSDELNIKIDKIRTQLKDLRAQLAAAKKS